MAGVQFAKRVEYRKKARSGTSLQCSVNHAPAGGADDSSADKVTKLGRVKCPAYDTNCIVIMCHNRSFATVWLREQFAFHIYFYADHRVSCAPTKTPQRFSAEIVLVPGVAPEN